MIKVSCYQIILNSVGESEEGVQIAREMQDYFSFGVTNSRYNESKEFCAFFFPIRLTLNLLCLDDFLTKISTFLKALNGKYLPKVSSLMAELESHTTNISKEVGLAQAKWRSSKEAKESFESANEKMQAAQKKGKLDLVKLSEVILVKLLIYNIDRFNKNEIHLFQGALL